MITPTWTKQNPYILSNHNYNWTENSDKGSKLLTPILGLHRDFVNPVWSSEVVFALCSFIVSVSCVFWSGGGWLPWCISEIATGSWSCTQVIVLEAAASPDFLSHFNSGHGRQPFFFFFFQKLGSSPCFWFLYFSVSFLERVPSGCDHRHIQFEFHILQSIWVLLCFHGLFFLSGC